MLAKTSELRAREIVNIIDGRKLGFPTDLEIEPQTGRILAIVAPEPGRSFRLFGRGARSSFPGKRLKNRP